VRSPEKIPPDTAAERVLIVNPEGLAERGGMGRMVRYLVGAVGRRKDGPAVEVLDSRGRHSAWLAPFYLTRTLLQIIHAAHAGGVRLVHVNMAENTSVLRKGTVVLLCRALGIPTLLHLHAGAFISFYEHLPAPARAFVRLVFRSATVTVVLGGLWKRHLVERLGIPESRIAVVPNGVPPVRTRRAARSNEPCRIIYVGKLRPEKGVPELIESLSQPDLQALPWSLTVVGDGAREALEARAAQTGIAGRVHFRGWLEADAVEAELAKADVYVLPSHYEGLPLAVLEALSARLAVVTTQVGALPEFLSDGVNARLVPPRDVIALHDALMELVSDQALRERLAEAGAALYAERFTVDAFTDAILALYDRIAPRKAAPSRIAETR
jgi:glycosyltransferase involved in cell wall biosynthesis